MEYFRILHKHIPYTCRQLFLTYISKYKKYVFTHILVRMKIRISVPNFGVPCKGNIYWKRHTRFFAVVSLGRHATYIVDTICIYYATYQMNTDPQPWLQQYCNVHCVSSCTDSLILQNAFPHENPSPMKKKSKVLIAN